MAVVEGEEYEPEMDADPKEASDPESSALPEEFAGLAGIIEKSPRCGWRFMKKQKGEAGMQIYGLKQATKTWNQKLNQTLIREGCKQAKAESCLCSTLRNSKEIRILIYEDDLIQACENPDNRKHLVNHLNKEVETAQKT